MFIKKSLIFFTTILFIGFGTAAPKLFTKSKELLIMKQPFVTVKLSISGCTYQVLVNDVPIMSDDEGIPVDVTLPVNEWMRSGENSLSMKLGPVKDAKKLVQLGQSCQAKIDLQVRDFKAPMKDTIILSQLNYQAPATTIAAHQPFVAGSTEAGHYRIKDFKLHDDKEGDIQQLPIHLESSQAPLGQGVSISRDFIAPFNLPEWAWFKGEKIKNDEQTKEQLLKQYQIIWDALKNKDFQKLKPLFVQRIKEYSEAYYVKPDQMDVVTALEKSSENPKNTLAALAPFKYAHLKIMGDSKLARLLIWDGSGLIAYNNISANTSSDYDIYFMKKNDKWIIIR